MKINKIFSLALLAATVGVMASCSPSEEDDIFDSSAAERLNAASDLYSSRLTAQPNGWAMQLYPTLQDETPYGNGYLLLLRFHKNHVVDAAMSNSLSNNVYTSDSSNWDVITDDGPVLSFNTHNNVIHTFSDPEDVASTGTSDVPNDETGTGIGGDYEFIIVDAPEDASYMMLKGKKRGTYNLLTPVEEGVDYRAYFTDLHDFSTKIFPANYPTYNLLHAGDSLYRFEGADDGLPSIYPDGADAVISQTFNPFLITKRGSDYYLRFRDQRTYNGMSVQDFHYVTDSDRFVSVDNPEVYISGNDPVSFFTNYLATSSNRWSCYEGNNLRSRSAMSDSFGSIFDAISSEFRGVNRSYYIRSIALRNVNGDIKLSIDYTGRTPTRYIDYDLNMTQDDNGYVSFAYTGCDDPAQRILNRVPSIQNLINFITSSSFSISGGETNFNLTNIRLTSTSDSNNWFVVSM